MAFGLARSRIDTSEWDGSEICGDVSDGIGMEKGQRKVSTFILRGKIDTWDVHRSIAHVLSFEQFAIDFASLRGRGLIAGVARDRVRVFPFEHGNSDFSRI